MADEGFGTRITFASGFMAEIDEVQGPGFKRASIETDHMLTPSGWITRQPSDRKDPGVVKVKICFNPDTTPPITNAAETITVTWPIPAGKTNGATWACSGFMTEFEPTAPKDGKMTGAATLEFSGIPVFTPSS